jgi:acylphosphatase
LHRPSKEASKYSKRMKISGRICCRSDSEFKISVSGHESRSENFNREMLENPESRPARVHKVTLESKRPKSNGDCFSLFSERENGQSFLTGQ